MDLHPGTVAYLLETLAATPGVLARLAAPHGAQDARWDDRPDPERFTPREVVAHLADWEEIFLERLNQTLRDDEPTLVNRDEGAIAFERSYASSDPHASLKRFAHGRAQILAFFATVHGEAWTRVGVHEHYGPMTLETQLVQIAAHDGNHVMQLLRSL